MKIEEEFEKIIEELTLLLSKEIRLDHKINETEFNKALKQSEEIHNKIFKKYLLINSEKVFLKVLYSKYQIFEKKIENYFSKRPTSKGQEKFIRKKIKEFQQHKKVNESPNPMVK